MTFVSTIALWAPFAAIFVTPMDSGQLFFALLLIMTFGWASGYFISFFVPYRYCGLSAVAWSVFWSLLWSGQAIRIHDMPQAKFLFYSSGPRWFLEGFFYASRPAWQSNFFCKFNVDLPAGLDGLALQEGSLRPDQGRHLPEERRDAVPAELGLLANLLAMRQGITANQFL